MGITVRFSPPPEISLPFFQHNSLKLDFLKILIGILSFSNSQFSLWWHIKSYTISIQLTILDKIHSVQIIACSSESAYSLAKWYIFIIFLINSKNERKYKGNKYLQWCYHSGKRLLFFEWYWTFYLINDLYFSVGNSIFRPFTHFSLGLWIFMIHKISLYVKYITILINLDKLL